MVMQLTETERRKKQCGGFMHDENSVSGNNLLEHYKKQSCYRTGVAERVPGS